MKKLHEIKKPGTLIYTYARCKTLGKIATGNFLKTNDDNLLGHFVIQAKLARIDRTAMPFKMRLAAMLASDTRRGKTWPI